MSTLIFHYNTISTKYIHRNRVRTELYIHRDVKVVDRFDQADAADLEQVVDVFIRIRKALDDAEDETEISLDVRFPGLFVPFGNLLEQCFFFLFAQERKFTRIYAAYFNFILCHVRYLAKKI